MNKNLNSPVFKLPRKARNEKQAMESLSFEEGQVMREL